MQLTRHFGRPWLSAARAVLATALPVCLAMAARGEEKPQAAAKRPGRATVALIDMNYVFENYAGFQKGKEEMEVDEKLAKTLLALRKASVEKLDRDRQKHPRGSDEYRHFDQLHAQETSELQVQEALAVKQLVRQQTELYQEAHQQIQKTVDAYVEEHGLAVVLRFTRQEATELGDPKEVALLLGRPIVAYKQAADITDEILRRLEKAPALGVARRPRNSARTK